MRKMVKSMINFMAGVLFGVLLNPSLKGTLRGFILLPHMGYDEESGTTFVSDIGFIPYDEISYPANSSFIFGSGLVPILLPAIDNPAHRDQAFSLLCDRLLTGIALKDQNGEEWFALTDLKRSGDAIAFCGSYSKLSEVMGAPLFELKDPIKSFKVLLPPSRLSITGDRGLAKRGVLRVALADIAAIKTDGGIISKVGLKHSDYDREGAVGPMRYVKYSYQIRHNTMAYKSGHKKGKVTYDPALHRYMCKLAKIDHRLCDMIMAVDNIKSTTQYVAGDIIEIPVSELRVIKMKERQSPTRGGAQIRRIPWSALRLLMGEKSVPNIAAAVVMRHASKGNAHAIGHILQVPFSVIPAPCPELRDAMSILADVEASKDVKQYFEDGLGLFIQLLASAKWVTGKDGAYWQVPMYGDPFAAVMGRLRAWYFDRVIKVQLGDFSFYVEVAPHLKRGECILPNNPELIEIANSDGMFLTGMRPPIVSRANLQPLRPKRYANGRIKTNRTDDTIYVSPESLLSMFGDTDGDMLYIITSKVEFKFRLRTVVEEAKFKWLPSTYEELSNLIKMKSSQVAQASLEVGLRDRAASIIYDEREMSGRPITDPESIRMADEWLENAIKSFKHDGTSIMGDAAISEMCYEYGTDNIRKLRALPRKPLPQTQLFRRKIGSFGKGSGSDKVKMNSLSIELERFYTHVANVNLGVCKPGENAHPYLPVFNALRGFKYYEDIDRCEADHELFTKQWVLTKQWLDKFNPRLQYKIIDIVKHIESLYNSSASYAITLSSYSGESPEGWWPFCIYNSIGNRREWATHIHKNGMYFEFTKTSHTGYRNKLGGVVTMGEIYELLSTGRISTLQKRARFKALREEMERYIEEAIVMIQAEARMDHDTAYKCIATALGYRVFGIRKHGGGVRNAREFMAVNDNIKLSVYNVIFKSPWGSVARKAWDSLTAYYADLEDVNCAIEEETVLESVDEDSNGY